ncbi:MAG: TolC family protein [Thermoanaerobaculia bacterium]
MRSAPSRRLVRSTLALVLLCAPAVRSQTMQTTTAIPDLSVAPDLRIEDGRLQLDLEDAIAIALQRNLSLVVQRYNNAESRYRLTQSLGIYDPLATADLATSDETSPSATNLAGADVQTTEIQTWNFGLSQLLSTGGTLRADFLNNRQETNSTFASVNPAFRSDFDITWNQPLLRNFGRDATDRQIRVSNNNVGISRETFVQDVHSTIQSVANAYWTLLEAQYQLEVAHQAHDLAEQLHEQNRIRVDVGTLAPLELVQSEAGVATRDEEIIRAEAAVQQAEDDLRQLLNLERGELWATPIELDPSDQREPVDVDLEQAINRALENRPELAQQRLRLQNLAIDQEFFHDQRLPQVDLQVRYGFNGLGGDVTDRDFITGEILSQTQGSYSDALDQITGGDFDGWRVGLNVSYPLRNRAAKAASAIADLAYERGEAQLADLQLQVRAEVRRAVRALDTAEKAITTAEASRRLQERNLEAEQKRYDNGLSTSFQVLEIQEDLANARSREIAAHSAYQRALVEFWRSVGGLDAESGVTLEIDEPE